MFSCLLNKMTSYYTENPHFHVIKISVRDICLYVFPSFRIRLPSLVQCTLRSLLRSSQYIHILETGMEIKPAQQDL